MRKNEAKEVNDNISKKLGIRLITINAQKVFFHKLKGISNPERKRKIIGETFIRVFEQQSRKIKNVDYLAQGTI